MELPDDARFCDSCGALQAKADLASPASKQEVCASRRRTDWGAPLNRTTFVTLLLIGIIGAGGVYYYYGSQETGPMKQVTTTVSVQVTPTSVGLTGQDLVGNWMNTDPNTGGWIRVQITQYGGSYSVHIWGACTPTPCDGGSAPLVMDGPTTAHAFFNHGFATRNMTFLLLSPSELKVTTFTHFTDNSGRSDYTKIDTFYKT
jgi:hypothetical protein